MNELLTLGAVELARLIRDGRVSSEEVTTACVRRAAELQPALNAVAFEAYDRALMDARDRDARLRRGEAPGPLFGVPFTVKDWIEAGGLPCAAGELHRRHEIAPEDATAVARLREAGAVLLGKTALFATSDAYGTVNNPYGEGLSPGGSSSGDAALVAAGGTPFGLGSDSGGSIRQPAHYCGVAGLKPTSGRVPLTGHKPRINPLADPRTVIGPLARRVADLGVILRVIAGEDGRDASVVPVPLADPGEVHVPVLRVAFYTDDGGRQPTLETVQAVHAAAKVLESLGCAVRHESPPGLDEAMPITRAYWARPESEDWDEWVGGESRLTADEVERHLFQWDRFRRRMLGFMRATDVILTPVAHTPAVPHGQPDGGVGFTAPYSLTGYPCVVVRCGASPEGLPIGVQVVAAPWREHVALAVAAVLEEALGGWRAPGMLAVPAN